MKKKIYINIMYNLCQKYIRILHNDMLFMTNKRLLEVFYVLFYVHKNISDYYTYIVHIWNI